MTRAVPYSKSDERFYTRLAVNAGSPIAPRQIWRAGRAYPHLETGRIRDAMNRVWIVPSTRTEGLVYRVDLKTGECVSLPGYELSEVCPNLVGKARCVHFQAATIAERLFLAENHDNRLIFPGKAARSMEGCHA